MTCKSGLCEPCLYVDKEIEAEGFCSTCAECLCSNCIIEHRKVKLTRNHVINQDSIPDNGNIIKEMNEMLVCPFHKEMKISYWCEGHKLYICTICRVDTHRECEHVLEIVQSDGELKSMHDSLEKLKLKTVSLKERKKGNRKLLYQSRAEILSKQETLIQKYINDLEELKEKMARETEEKFQVAVNEIDKELESIKAIEQTAVKNIEILKAAEKYGNSNCQKAMWHLLTDDVMVQNDMVQVIDKQEEYMLMFVINEDGIQISSPGALSLIRGERRRNNQGFHEIGIDKTSDELIESESSSFAPMDTVVNSSAIEHTILSSPCIDDTVVKSSCGELTTVKSESHLLPAITKQFVTELREFRIRDCKDSRNCCIYGISVLQNGFSLMIDNDNTNIKLLSSDFTILDVLKLPGKPLRICSIGDNNVAVSFVSLKRINRYSVASDTISYDGGFRTSLFNRGIGFHDHNIVAIMCDKNYYCHIYEKDTIHVEFRDPFNGNINDVIRDFRVDGPRTWSLALKNSMAIQFTENNHMIIAEQNRIMCFSLRKEFGKTIAVEKSFYVCKKAFLKGTFENIAIANESIFVCTASGCVLQLSSSDLKNNRIVVPDNGEALYAIAVDNLRGRVIIGCQEKDEILVYEIKNKP